MAGSERGLGRGMAGLGRPLLALGIGVAALVVASILPWGPLVLVVAGVVGALIDVRAWSYLGVLGGVELAAVADSVRDSLTDPFTSVDVAVLFLFVALGFPLLVALGWVPTSVALRWHRRSRATSRHQP